MPIQSASQSLQSQSLLLARYTSTAAPRRPRDEDNSKSDEAGESANRAAATFEASYAAMNIRVSQGDGGTSTSVDSIQINLSANMTIEDANKILKDRLADKINEAFRQAGVNLDIREVEKQNQDTSPEATSRRIVDFATGFMGAYAKNHAAEDPESRLDGFMSLIRDAIDKGFADARGILEGIADITGPISDNIDKTYELTGKGLDEFRKKQLELIANSKPQAPEGGQSASPAEAIIAAA